MELKHFSLELRDNAIAVLTIKRADSDRNLLNPELVGEMDHVLAVELPRLDARVLVIVSGYEKVFSTGADIVAIGDVSRGQALAFAQRGKAVFGRLLALPQPSIAAINGFCLGGGLELALHCDLRIATAGARLGLPEVGLGIIPGWGGTQLLPRLIGGARALRMILSGEPLNAQAALSCGLVDELADDYAALLPAALKLAARFTARPAGALALARAALHGGASMALTDAMELESQLFSAAWDTEERRSRVKALMDKAGSKGPA